MRITLKLPWPPSANNLYPTVKDRAGKLKRVRSRQLKNYTADVIATTYPATRLHGPLSARFYLTPPDGRVRDVDNHLKAVQDALKKAGFYSDDSNIRKIQAEMFDPEKGKKGEVLITLEELDGTTPDRG